MCAEVVGEGGVALERWRQFTPMTIDIGKCMARTWSRRGGGLGGQCGAKCVDGGDLCRRHGKHGALSHGRVDGDIPDAKFEDFVKASSSVPK